MGWFYSPINAQRSMDTVTVCTPNVGSLFSGKFMAESGGWMAEVESQWKAGISLCLQQKWSSFGFYLSSIFIEQCKYMALRCPHTNAKCFPFNQIYVAEVIHVLIIYSLHFINIYVSYFELLSLNGAMHKNGSRTALACRGIEPSMPYTRDIVTFIYGRYCCWLKNHKRLIVWLVRFLEINIKFLKFTHAVPLSVCSLFIVYSFLWVFSICAES